MRTAPSPTGYRVLARVVFCIIIAAHLALIIQSVGVQRLWEDEAFNLTVPLNLLAGLGYASDGTLSGSQITPFDVRISTGPTVLLPVTVLIGLGFDPVIGGRLVAAVMWVLLVAGLAVIGRRISGSWGAIVAAAVPLTLHTFQGNSPIQGPADLLGEPAAAALIVWAIILVGRRPALAGLIMGLAIQAKFIALLALPALALGLLVARRVPPRRWAAELWRPAVFAFVPTMLYELAALIHLGATGFTVHAKEFVYFLLSSGQTVEPTTISERLQFLMSSWFVPAPIVWPLALGGTILVVLALRSIAHTWRDEQRTELVSIAVITFSGLFIYLAWWLTASHTPLWIRHPSPALLAFTPILGAFVVLGVSTLLRTERFGVLARDPRPEIRRGIGALAAVSIGVVMLAQAGLNLHDSFAPRVETLATQRAEATALAAFAAEHSNATEYGGARDGSDWLAADPWGGAVNIIVLTGAHIGLSDAPNMNDTLRVTWGECSNGTLVGATQHYALCTP